MLTGCDTQEQPFSDFDTTGKGDHALNKSFPPTKNTEAQHEEHSNY